MTLDRYKPELINHKAIEKSFVLQEWADSELLTADQVSAKESFLHMATCGPSTLFEQYANHPFWLNWVSKGSGHKIFGVAAIHAHDVRWFDVFTSKPFAPTEEEFKHVVLASTCYPHPKIKHIISLALDKNLLSKDDNEFFKKVAYQCAQVGALDAILYLSSEKMISRLEGLERSLMTVSTLNGRAVNTDFKEGLDVLWGLWGAPNQDTLFGMLLGFVSARTKRISLARQSGLDYIFDQLKENWSDDYDQKIMDKAVKARHPNAIAWFHNKGHTFSDSAWTIVDEFIRSTYHQENWQELKQQHVLLTLQANTKSQLSAATSRANRKM